MSFSSEMPLSCARARTASTISWDMWRSVLHEVGTVDLGVRDGDHPGVGGDGDLGVRGAHQLAREAPATVVVGMAGADSHAGAPAEEAAEVLGLGERALGPGRGDLERVVLADLAEVARDALAESEGDAVGM